ncbi:MAG TPA: bifunctional (p)ppGpp synthetase/guanosine-3',5'-bis(diphosphate) 3'-pyrophosphohydrolase [Bacteroidales bacterium]|nr:bifunctional (p)ppGpp synthetase/guanosine-3',5'-bis(diphosphate) 3'-pyrophosphohydrolase [Bacteroidales bacterium]HPS16214.1 bifunctional (p)ppGpp synthetase/guanosine-3',5'-bis(diphosphate) 3'-pyrophosphohydrolase [Bacteroidales bacterium]
MQEINVEKERIEIIKRYRSLLKVCKVYTSAEDKRVIRKAFNLAVEAHKDMRRKSGEPYIYHPIAVATIATSEIGLGTTSIVCALLHDVVEDTDYTLTDIRELFGEKVARIIDGLTKISEIFDHSSPSMQAENFRKMLLTLSDDVRVILIKLADRLHNMRTLDAMPKQKQLKIAYETSYLFAPLAHRLGLYTIKSELEDLAMKYTEPEIFQNISQRVKEREEERIRFITRFMSPIKKEMKKQGIKYTILHRQKSINSIWEKMKKKEIPFEEIYDLFAVRIILDTPPENEKSECWKVYSIVTDFYRPNPDRLRDWISNPKANGYESLHTTVMSNTGQWVEVQIRSERMDEIAEKGYAAHWKYKDHDNQEKGLDEWLKKIRELLKSNEANALDFLDDFKLNLFADEMFIFTPKGDLKTLPVNSTALDFAYNIHSKVGDNCIGAKVNHKLVPLNHKLKSGDQVEIITSAKQKPKEDWLYYVITARAKTCIKASLKDDKKQVAEEGKEILMRKFKQLKMEFNNTVLGKLHNFYKLPNSQELFYQVAIGKIGLREIKAFQEKDKGKWLKYLTSPFSRLAGKEKVDPVKTKTSNINLIMKDKADTLLIGDNMDKLQYTLSPCCNPIPGDNVFGFVTINEGIKIHRANCPNAINMLSKYAYRTVKAKWTNNESIAFLAGIKILGSDKMGIVNNITKIISNELNLNMRSISIESDAGTFEGTVMLYVNDTKHLNDLIQNLKKVDGVQRVFRIDKAE